MEAGMADYIKANAYSAVTVSLLKYSICQARIASSKPDNPVRSDRVGHGEIRTRHRICWSLPRYPLIIAASPDLAWARASAHPHHSPIVCQNTRIENFDGGSI